jgi:hypothetical protein
MAAHITTQTVDGISSATLVSIDGQPDIPMPTVYSRNETTAALALCVQLVASGQDPELAVSVPTLPGFIPQILERAI